MSDYTQDSQRLKDADSLTAMETAGTDAINRLKAIKINIVDLKNKQAADPVYTQEDNDKLQAVIDSLLAGIATI